VRVRRIALTGGIATGKSYVLGALARAGVPTNDADLLARQAVAPGTPAHDAIAARFGPSILDSTGALDRRALARIVFTDDAARRDLEAIVHPLVRAATDAWFAQIDPARHPYAVVAIPLLYEAGRDRDFDAVIVTACAPGTQLQRLMARDHLGEADARQRIAAQMPMEEKARRGDYVIRTDGSFEATDHQIAALLAAL
jgi:dephospho-CoA kinase